MVLVRETRGTPDGMPSGAILELLEGHVSFPMSDVAYSGWDPSAVCGVGFVAKLLTTQPPPPPLSLLPLPLPIPPAPQKSLFAINARFHGAGKVLFAWQPGGNFLATSGTNGAWEQGEQGLCVCGCFEGLAVTTVSHTERGNLARQGLSGGPPVLPSSPVSCRTKGQLFMVLQCAVLCAGGDGGGQPNQRAWVGLGWV